MKTDPSGRYGCLYKRWYLIGLEAGISVASVGLPRLVDRFDQRAVSFVSVTQPFNTTSSRER